MTPYQSFSFVYFIILVLVFVINVEETTVLTRRHTNRRRMRNSSSIRRKEFIRRRLQRFRNRNRDYEGKIRLVDGQTENEGNVEIYHDGRWGNICDDEWDLREAEIVCKYLGFPDALKVTYSSHFGNIKQKYWMDNLYCHGSEKKLTDCRHDGWGKHDCELDEAAGLICQSLIQTTTELATTPLPVPKDEPKPDKRVFLKVYEGEINLRLRGGRIETEGRVEILLPYVDTWGLICGDDWSLLEAMVVCRQLGLGYAQSAPSTGFFGGNSSNITVSGIKCIGNENKIALCLHNLVEDEPCFGSDPDVRQEPNIASVTCAKKMADLAPDIYELARSTYLEDKQLFFLQCAIEENCLASAAYKYMNTTSGWHLESRRLLRFTARIINQGDDVFFPFLPKSHWQWHQCHMHYHSMEVFANYDIVDDKGIKVAEGHKASFCLEDNNCLPGVTPTYKCANFGDQGISPGCTDTYAYNIDCQWVDITELKPGRYKFKVSVNPQMKVAEKTFDNNAAVCDLYYEITQARLINCTLTSPDKHG